LEALVALLLAMAVFATGATTSGDTSSADGPDPAKLVGRWLRADGGYILQLSDPGSDGSLKAEYFNPRPINVAHAAWKHQEGYLGVFIELRAPNYPGSTYTLAYDHANDRLLGIYFQAAMQQKFEVEFERIP
jgi:hypothetical protein